MIECNIYHKLRFRANTVSFTKQKAEKRPHDESEKELELVFFTLNLTLIHEFRIKILLLLLDSLTISYWGQFLTKTLQHNAREDCKNTSLSAKSL